MCSRVHFYFKFGFDLLFDAIKRGGDVMVEAVIDRWSIISLWHSPSASLLAWDDSLSRHELQRRIQAQHLWIPPFFLTGLILHGSCSKCINGFSWVCWCAYELNAVLVRDACWPVTEDSNDCTSLCLQLSVVLHVKQTGSDMPTSVPLCFWRPVCGPQCLCIFFCVFFFARVLVTLDFVSWC